MSKVVLLRPYIPAATLRAMVRERAAVAVDALKAHDYERFELFKAQANELDREAQRAARWEAECEAAGKAADDLIQVIRRRQFVEAIAEHMGADDAG